MVSTKTDAGRHGEYLTYKNLKSYEDRGGKCLFNCYLPTDNGETTEIDVMLIHEKGIFCLESKNYSGWIFGDEKSKNWTQTLPTGRGRSHKERFLNPIIQNKVHIKWLKKQIGEDIPVYSIIVFSERCTLKKVTVQSPDIYVINRPMVSKMVKEIEKKQSVQLKPEMVDMLYDSLYPYTQVSSKVKEQHVERIRNKKSDKACMAADNVKSTEQLKSMPPLEKQESIQVPEHQNKIKTEDICPQCGAELVLRTAKRGNNSGKQFYGCSGFPKCRFIRNL